jgi:Tol biopolymer transport system component
VGRVRFDAKTGVVQGVFEALTSGPRDFERMDISPDGLQLVVATAQRQQEDLYLMATDGTGMRQLTNDSARDRAPRWSPDGRHVLFYSDRGGTFFELWTIDRDGSGLRKLTTSQGLQYPVPSHDGARVAATAVNAWQVYIYDAQDFSKAPEVLPPLPVEWRQGNLAVHDWSPDSRELKGSTGSVAWVYSLDQHVYSQLQSKVSFGIALTWLRDGRFVFTQQGRLFLADPTGNARPIYTIDGDAISYPRVNADGSYVYFEHGSQSGDIWIVRFDEAKR